ncbi:MAG: nucleotidyltransferase family protein [Candidatus Aminicenantia bacterium]
MRPEQELLLCCSRINKDLERVKQIKALLHQNINWIYLTRIADQHGVLPIVYRTLKAICPEDVPQDIMNQLRNLYLINSGRNLLLTRELFNLLDLFKNEGITAIPYKGPALAVLAYGNLSLRQFSDLDILIHERDGQRAKDLLISCGYRSGIQLTAAQEEAFIQSQRTYKFLRDDGRVIADLQWGITPRYFPFLLDPECLWTRLESIYLDGKEILSFSPEDLLLILCVHGLCHCWERLIWICDVAKLIEVHQRMDWERVMKQTVTLGIERILFLGLFLVNDLLGVALPKEILQRMQYDPIVKTLTAQVREHLFYKANHQSRALKCGFFQLKVWKRLQDRIRYCIYRATIPTIAEWEFLFLPAFLFPFYYLLRPIRLLRMYGLNIVRYIYKGIKAK